MLDRIDLRLDEEDQDKPQDVGDAAPNQSRGRLPDFGEPAFAAPETKPFVDGVQAAVDRLQTALEELRDQPEQPGQEVAKVLPATGRPVGGRLFEVAAQARGQKEDRRQKSDSADD